MLAEDTLCGIAEVYAQLFVYNQGKYPLLNRSILSYKFDIEEMKLIITMLIVSTLARYNQIRNFRKHHRNTNGRMERRSDEEPVYQAERLGSSVDKAAFRQYYLQKFAEKNDFHSHERLNRWFSHFKKYCTFHK